MLVISGISTVGYFGKNAVGYFGDIYGWLFRGYIRLDISGVYTVSYFGEICGLVISWIYNNGRFGDI